MTRPAKAHGMELVLGFALVVALSWLCVAVLVIFLVLFPRLFEVSLFLLAAGLVGACVESERGRR